MPPAWRRASVLERYPVVLSIAYGQDVVEYCDLMTSISTVSHGVLFNVFSKYVNLHFNVGYSEMYRANGHLIGHN